MTYEPAPEPFGPEYLRPASLPCPDCECCTVPLCERGRRSPMGSCAAFTTDEAQDTVRGCRCSAETTPGTAAYEAAQVRATRHATERPLPLGMEALLQALAEGLEYDEEEAARLEIWRYAVRVGGRLAVTDAGRTYLAARDGAR
ncbi:hypothetical protein [Streptomyces sp. NPDC051173]|uniref:hypothetical protein n=1 Tax=Streptomyces sp. NPDC051173 TaxID=3155164 RepID=UPI00344C90EC